MQAGYYVTGTDTGAGKTVVSAALLHALRAGGGTAVGMKPVASGCVMGTAGWRNDDALALQAASVPLPEYDTLNPFALPEATAPQIAAARAGIRVSLPPILAAFAALAAQADAVVVEGVGGWLAPLADGLEQSQLVAALQLPVILVVGMKLGCLNHARLTERTILAEGFTVAGWIGNAVEPGMEFAGEYEVLLRAALHSPCLGLLPHAPGASSASLSTRLKLLP